MSDLAGLLAKTFIARKDVKASQNTSGEYMPVQHCEQCGRGFCSHQTPKIREAWRRADIEAHLAGDKTFGHYLLNNDDQCKIFAFDIDLDDPEMLRKYDQNLTCTYPTDEGHEAFVEFNPRAAWLDRGHPARTWMKSQLKTVANELMRVVHRELELPVACTYTGAKGLHVYALMGLMSARDARDGIEIVLDALSETHLGGVSLFRGTNFYRFDNQDPFDGQQNLTIEVFPKQESLDGKDLGNLMRLPLGRNLKNPSDPTFFVDMTSALNEIKPLDPIYALTEGSMNPWRRQGE